MSKPTNVLRTIARVVSFCFALLFAAANSAQAISLETVYTFSNTYSPPSFLIQAANGDYYGAGGDQEESIGVNVFRMFRTNPGDPLQLEWKSIKGANGLLQASNGTIYVTTYWSDQKEYGAIYKIENGTTSVVHSFDPATTGAFPEGRLVEGPDGNFYGTLKVESVTNEGKGSIFRITTNGVVTTLHVFDGTNGSSPRGALIRGSDSCLYGMTMVGGIIAPGWPDGMGTIFKITTNGVYSVLHKFDGSSGISPKGELVEGSDGNFYGMAEDGGNGHGIVFKMTPAGIVTTLHAFNGYDGSYPNGQLVEGTNGAFYGVTPDGGLGLGTLFKVTPSGAFTLLRKFDGDDGGFMKPSNPVLSADGYIYGTVPDADLNGHREPGYIYRFIDDPTSDAPSIQTQPEHSTNLFNISAVFSVQALGLQPLSYQWRWNGTNLVDGPNISGANTSGLRLMNVNAAMEGSYSVVITNLVGSVTSSVAVLTILDPAILTHPVNRTTGLGSNATFSVSAIGSGTLNYQWKKNGTNLVDGGNISGAHTPTLTVSVTATDAGTYSVVVSNANDSVESSGAQLTIAEPVIISQPTSKNILWGESAQFSVVASGIAPISYQWKRNGTNLVDGGNISGATTSTLTVANATPTNNGFYTVEVSSTGGTASSLAATLSVSSNPNVISQPVSVTNSAGSTVTFQASVAGPSPMVFQWARGEIYTNGSHSAVFLNNGGKLSGVHTTTLTITNVTAAEAGNYFLLVADTTNKLSSAPFQFGTTRSAQATLTVLTPPTLTSQPASRVVYVGTNTTLSVSATGSGTLTYQWNKNGMPVSDATNASLALNNLQLTDSGNYTVTVTGSEASITTQPARVSVVYRKAIYNGLFYETNAVRHEASGSFTVTFNGTNYSAKIILEGLASGFSGKLDANAETIRTIVRTNFNRQNLSINFALDPLNNELHGTVAGPGWNAELTADHYPYTASSLATAYQGNYTMVFPGSSDGAQGPVGYSSTAISVTSLGRLKLVSGLLADGQPLVTSTTLSADGRWPLYSPAYAISVTNGLKKWKEYRGSAIGWITFTNNEPVGNVSWIKTAWTNSLYGAGFTNESEAFGSQYTFTKGVRSLDLTNGTFTFSGGNLASPFSATVLLTTNNTFTAVLPLTNKASSTFTAKAGVFRGSFRHPENTNVVTKFGGVVLQNENAGAGYFAGTNHAGMVILQPAP